VCIYVFIYIKRDASGGANMGMLYWHVVINYIELLKYLWLTKFLY